MQKEKAMLCPDLGIQTDDTALFCPNAEQGPVPFADRRRSDAGLAGQFRLCHTQLAKLCRQSNLNRNRQPHPAPTQERGENDLGSCDICTRLEQIIGYIFIYTTNIPFGTCSIADFILHIPKSL